jgi:hypothetical protein
MIPASSDDVVGGPMQAPASERTSVVSTPRSRKCLFMNAPVLDFPFFGYALV